MNWWLCEVNKYEDSTRQDANLGLTPHKMEGQSGRDHRTMGKQQKQSFRRVICLIHKAVKMTGEKNGEDKRGEVEGSFKEG